MCFNYKNRDSTWLMRKKILFLILSIPLLFYSCKTVVSVAFGINEPKLLTDEELEKLSIKHGISPANSYKIDTAYFSFLKSIDEEYADIAYDHGQPLQALYFNRNKELLSFQTVTYAEEESINLKWYPDSIFSTFPPKEQAPLDTIVTYDKIIEYVNLLPNSNTLTPIETDYIVVVFWANFLERPSKKLIEIVNENIKTATHESIKVVYVNVDNFFYYQLSNNSEF